ncbi:3-hydroxyacyl-[acyl-carrier-protein] dehydratase [Deinococcus reticulitermitis]|uniref:3-hydroxyacyl-[acyl-carrier-protein] dehydratase FabZ n=2 Tax=Deinococcus reticulitermitis TaxID=856736 RepID=A0A1H6T5K7_9DEIO|nr:3-hydroxyacyl-[acyl-carrier-protein] dehydratase [Deinococcus reticulitermitis]
MRAMSPLMIQEVLATLPHRFPFVLIDRVLEYGNGEVHAIKNVTIGEPFFSGHFPAEPVMPGVLITEALAQASMFCLREGLEPGQIGYLAGVDGARFKRKVVPGDQLHLYARLDFLRRGLGKTVCRAEVDGGVVAEATILFAIGK